MYPYTEDRVDVDRVGYAYIVTVRSSLNKKNELVEEVIRVKHLGKATPELMRSVYLPLHSRAIDSGDFLGTYMSNAGYMCPNRDHTQYAIKASLLKEGL